MKFHFECYAYDGETDYIEINFDFLNKSELIKALEPEPDSIIPIPEKFSKFQIDEFKILLEKITNKDEITEEDKHLAKSKVLKPLIEYFKMDLSFYEVIDSIKENKKYYVVHREYLRCDRTWKSQDTFKQPPMNYNLVFSTFKEAKHFFMKKIMKEFNETYYENFTDDDVEDCKIKIKKSTKEFFLPRLIVDPFINNNILMWSNSGSCIKYSIIEIDLTKLNKFENDLIYSDYKFKKFED